MFVRGSSSPAARPPSKWPGWCEVVARGGGTETDAPARSSLAASSSERSVACVVCTIPAARRSAEARRAAICSPATVAQTVHMLSACFSAVHMHISMVDVHIPRNTQVWCTCGARSCSPATVRCGTAAYVQSAAVECALYGRVSRCRSASLCVCTACMCSVRALHTPRSGQGGCRSVVDLTASTHAAGWRARCGAGGSRSARAARSARG